MAAISKSKETLQEYGRGVVGGLLISLPLIYTMEVWWTGFTASPEALLACIGFTFMLLLGYNRFAGMRADATFGDLCWDSVEEIGLAFLVSFLFLWLIGQIDFGMSAIEIIGKTVTESMIVAIGISVGTAQLGPSEGSGQTGMNRREGKQGKFFELFILSICGAVLFGSSVASTDEILLIAASVSALQLLLMVLLSLGLCAVICFFSEFRGSGRSVSTWFEMAGIVALMYAVGFAVSVLLLFFFRRFDGVGLYMCVAQTVVLAIPAALGASAGRLIIEGDNAEEK